MSSAPPVTETRILSIGAATEVMAVPRVGDCCMVFMDFLCGDRSPVFGVTGNDSAIPSKRTENISSIFIGTCFQGIREIFPMPRKATLLAQSLAVQPWSAKSVGRQSRGRKGHIVSTAPLLPWAGTMWRHGTFRRGTRPRGRRRLVRLCCPSMPFQWHRGAFRRWRCIPDSSRLAASDRSSPGGP